MLLSSSRIAHLKDIFSEIEKRYCFEFDAIGTDGDHVHIFVGAARDMLLQELCKS